MRFYEKDAVDMDMAVSVPEHKYSAHLPREFEVRAVRTAPTKPNQCVNTHLRQALYIRVFCRHPEKAQHARRAFERWCTKSAVQAEVPYSQSEQA
jgi:hypothetical protein